MSEKTTQISLDDLSKDIKVQDKFLRALAWVSFRHQPIYFLNNFLGGVMIALCLFTCFFNYYLLGINNIEFRHNFFLTKVFLWVLSFIFTFVVYGFFIFLCSVFKNPDFNQKQYNSLFSFMDSKFNQNLIEVLKSKNEVLNIDTMICFSIERTEKKYIRLFQMISSTLTGLRTPEDKKIITSPDQLTQVFKDYENSSIHSIANKNLTKAETKVL